MRTHTIVHADRRSHCGHTASYPYTARGCVFFLSKYTTCASRGPTDATIDFTAQVRSAAPNSPPPASAQTAPAEATRPRVQAPSQLTATNWFSQHAGMKTSKNAEVLNAWRPGPGCRARRAVQPFPHSMRLPPGCRVQKTGARAGYYSQYAHSSHAREPGC